MARMSAFFRSTRTVAGAMLALSLAPALAQAEIIRVGDMLAGIQTSQPKCSLTGHAVWVEVHGQSFCIRYFLSTAGGATGKPIVFLQGDQFGRLDAQSHNFNPPPDTQDTDTAKLLGFADVVSRAAGAPAIYLARVGVDGSSGHHRLRRTVLELHALDAALNLIRARHGFEGFHLAGQSGGAGLIGGLLALRSDIFCAAAGAGRMSLLRKTAVTGDPAKDHFNPSDAIGMIANNRGARIMIVTDPRDQVVEAKYQTAFVDELKRNGRHIEHYFVQATDEKNHGVMVYAVRATILCAQGAPAARIATDLDLLVQKRVAAAAQARTPALNTTPVAPRVYANTQSTGYAPPPPAPQTAAVPAHGVASHSNTGVRTDWPRLPRRDPAVSVYR